MNLYLGEPNEKQKLALQDTHRHVGYGGARGGGKSWMVRTKAVLLTGRWAGIKILIMRQTYPELEQNHIRQLRKLLPRSIATYNKTEKRFTFRNGSTIDFQYCKNRSSARKKSNSYTRRRSVRLILFDSYYQLGSARRNL